MTLINPSKFECKVCDYTSRSPRGIEIHISKKARLEEDEDQVKINLFRSSFIQFRQQFFL